MKLTAKQRAVLQFIESEIDRTGVIPSTREIQAHFGFSSQTGAMHHLQALEKKGAIQRREGLARAVILPNRPRATPAYELSIFGAIPAGMAVDAPEAAEEKVAFGPGLVGIQPSAETFALRVRGDSMEGAHIVDGDLAILERRAGRHGEVVAALIDGEVTLKRLILQAGKAYLHAENPAYPDLIPAHDLQIQGVLVGVLRKVGHGKSRN